MEEQESTRLLQTLRQEITCPLCLEIFTDPRKLPCDHVYCKDCLLRLVGPSGLAINCPECRERIQVPPGSPDLSCLSTPFRVNRMIEMYEQGVHDTDSTDGPPVSKLNTSTRTASSSSTAEDALAVQPASCPVHLSQDLSLYCETCEKLVCRDCILFSCAKSDHSYGYIKDVFGKHRSVFKDKLYPVTQLQKRGKEDIQEIKLLEKEIDVEEDKMVEEVESTFKLLFGVLEKEKSILTKSVRREFHDARVQASHRKEEVQDICTELETLIDTLSPACEHESEAEFLAQLKTRKQVIEAATKTALGLESPRATKPPNLGLNVLEADKLNTDCKNSFYHIHKDDPFRCHFDRNVEWNNLPFQTSTSVTLYIETRVKTWWSPRVEAELYCLYTKEKQKVEVVWASGWKSCTLAIKPERRGRHELNIKCKGDTISISPVQVYVSVPNLRSLKPLMSESFTSPKGIKCGEEYVYLSELTSGLAVLEARTLTRKALIPIPNVWEVFMDTKCKTLYGTGYYDNTVNMMDLDGNVLKTIGGSCSPITFTGPNGIGCSKNGEIFICDTGNNRIQVFDKELRFLREIGDNRLSSPDDLDFDDDGNVYVASQASHTISVFTTYGKFLRTIGKPGSKLGELRNPSSVAVSNNLVYVTDHSNLRISVFTTAGVFVSVFGEVVLKGPECIAIDKDGFMYISDMREKLYVF